MADIDINNKEQEMIAINVWFDPMLGKVYPVPDGPAIRVPAGTTATITFVPNTNCYLNALLIDHNQPIEPPTHTYTFTNISEAHDISIDFRQIEENKNGALLREEMRIVVKIMQHFIESTLNPDIDTHAPLSKLRYDLLGIDKMLRTLFGYVDKLSTESNLK